MIRKRHKRLISVYMSVMCMFCVTGCSVRLPVIIPNDTNVVKLAEHTMSDMTSFTSDINCNIELSSDNNKHVISKTGSIYGDIDSVVYGNISEVNTIGDISTELKSQWYLNNKQNVFYQKTSDSDWIGYDNGNMIYDVSWWSEQIDNLQYSGKGKTSSKEAAFVLSHTYSGDNLIELLRHLHINLDGDLSNVNIKLIMYIDKVTGQPLEFIIKSVDSDNQSVVLDGVKEQLNSFYYQIQFSACKSTPSLPKDVANLDLVKPNNYMLATELVNVGQDALSLNGYSVHFEKNDVFDSVIMDSKTRTMQVSSSSTLVGMPIITISIIDGMDAYSSAVSDADTALKFYHDSGLSDICVSSVIQGTVDNQSSFQYKAQYSDLNYEFVNTNYIVYIQLTDDSYVKVWINSIVDLGANVVLDDNYVSSILEQLIVDEVDVS